METPKRATGIRTVVVDDERLARSNLTVLLRQDPEILLVGEYDSGQSALTEISRTHPDLVFLDVQMPECDGFDVVEQLSADARPVIVFVTAYDQYALRAFETGALDYLLKPFDDARFDSALKRAKVRVRERRDAHPVPEHFIIKGTGQVSFVRISEIDWIQGADYYVCLHAGAETQLLRRSLYDLEVELSPRFCRIHRSTIVNLDRVKGLRLNPEGEYDVVLRTGPLLRISRRYRKQLESRLGMSPSQSDGAPFR